MFKIAVVGAIVDDGDDETLTHTEVGGLDNVVTIGIVDIELVNLGTALGLGVGGFGETLFIV